MTDRVDFICGNMKRDLLYLYKIQIMWCKVGGAQDESCTSVWVGEVVYTNKCVYACTYVLRCMCMCVCAWKIKKKGKKEFIVYRLYVYALLYEDVKKAIIPYNYISKQVIVPWI